MIEGWTCGAVDCVDQVTSPGRAGGRAGGALVSMVGRDNHGLVISFNRHVCVKPEGKAAAGCS